ncbi:MAG: sugar kinase [Candidatus Lokiarchaeota archaeon]|nr:sugar kinase [Candidatus Lokiarchaeota archaeon]
MKIFLSASSEVSVLEDTKEIIQILQNAGVDVYLEDETAKSLKWKYRSIKNVDADILMVIGSDKSLLSRLLEFEDTDTPILPIASKGQPDFLFDITVSDFDYLIEDIISGNWGREPRSRLSIEIDGQKGPTALNDVGIFARKSATLIRYSLFLNGEQFLKDGSDGIIVSTPTGSTAYSLSVGGPVVLSPAAVISIIPVNSINPANRPTIVSNDTEIEIRNISCSVTVEAILDGQLRKKVKQGTITIKKAENDVIFVQLSKEKIADLRGKLSRKTEEFDDLAQDLPPSAKLVLKVLEYKGPLTQKEIITESILPPRTARYALSILISEGLVTKRISLRDSRQGIYRVNEQSEKR